MTATSRRFELPEVGKVFFMMTFVGAGLMVTRFSAFDLIDTLIAVHRTTLDKMVFLLPILLGIALAGAGLLVGVRSRAGLTVGGVVSLTLGVFWLARAILSPFEQLEKQVGLLSLAFSLGVGALVAGRWSPSVSRRLPGFARAVLLLGESLAGGVVAAVGCLVVIAAFVEQPPPAHHDRAAMKGPVLDTASFRIPLESTTGGERAIYQVGTAATVVNFWAVWCQPCVEELPELEEFAGEMGSRGVALVLVNTDGGGRSSRVAAFLDQRQISQPSLLDRDDEVWERLQWNSIPLTVLLDRDGRAVQWWKGRIDIDDLRVEVLRLLGSTDDAG